MTENPERRTPAATEAGRAAQEKVQEKVPDEIQGRAVQAKDQAQRQAQQQAERQTQRTAGTVRQWADDLARMAERAPDDSPTREIVARAADGGRRAADYLEDRGPRGVVDDVQGFARQRPAAFLGGAALAGFAVGRLARAGSSQAGRLQARAGEPSPGQGGQEGQRGQRGQRGEE
ncbi:hypothetical protein [Streptomyces sp. 6N223]|uniref:hypothetical protein n=1 Tax=Streptomyces sp. 6N223 TaxID=3457412 RepID=UPI003FD2D7B4